MIKKLLILLSYASIISALETKVRFDGEYANGKKVLDDVQIKQLQELESEMNAIALQTLEKMSQLALKYAAIISIENNEPVLIMQLKTVPKIITSSQKEKDLKIKNKAE